MTETDTPHHTEMPRLLDAGEAALVAEFGTIVDPAISDRVLALEDALAAYQEGNELVRYCQTKLAEVEQKLQVLDAGELKELNLEPGE